MQIPDTEETIGSKGIVNGSTVIITLLEEINELNGFKFPLLQEELFENIGDDDFPSDLLDDINEDVNMEKIEDEKQEKKVIKLEEEFDNHYKMSQKETHDEILFLSPPLSSIEKDLEELLGQNWLK